MNLITPQATPRIVLVTGATNGIGKVTALELAKQGYRVLLTSRDAAKGRKVLDEIRTRSGNDALELFVGDLSSMTDVRRIALEVRERHDKLDVLINNAGGVFRRRHETVDGFESTFAFNHLSYFLLTNLLLDALKAAGNARVLGKTAPSGPARVVSVSSAAQFFGRLRWNDPQLKAGYTAFSAYSQSKLMNVLFANALARRLGGTGATSNALHPGVVRSGFGRDLRGFDKLFFNLAILSSVSVEKGAETSLYLATSPEVEGVTGTYFERKKPKRANPTAYDEAAQERLWALSEHLLSRWLDPVESAPVEARA